MVEGVSGKEFQKGPYQSYLLKSGGPGCWWTPALTPRLARELGLMDKVERCTCTVRTLSSVKPLVGEVTLTGGQEAQKTHVAEVISPLYDVIIGSDVMDKVGCEIATNKAGWSVKLGGRKFLVSGTMYPGKHTLVSAGVREYSKQNVIREVEEALKEVLAREDEELPATGRVCHTIETVDETGVGAT